MKFNETTGDRLGVITNVTQYYFDGNDIRGRTVGNYSRKSKHIELEAESIIFPSTYVYPHKIVTKKCLSLKWFISFEYLEM